MRGTQQPPSRCQEQQHRASGHPVFSLRPKGRAGHCVSGRRFRGKRRRQGSECPLHVLSQCGVGEAVAASAPHRPGRACGAPGMRLQLTAGAGSRSAPVPARADPDWDTVVVLAKSYKGFGWEERGNQCRPSPAPFLLLGQRGFVL